MRRMAKNRLSMSVMIGGAAIVAALALFGGRFIPVNDDDGWSVNDQGQTSGDTFLQNAQDQSTA